MFHNKTIASTKEDKAFITQENNNLTIFSNMGLVPVCLFSKLSNCVVPLMPVLLTYHAVQFSKLRVNLPAVLLQSPAVPRRLIMYLAPSLIAFIVA